MSGSMQPYNTQREEAAAGRSLYTAATLIPLARLMIPPSLQISLYPTACWNKDWREPALGWPGLTPDHSSNVVLLPAQCLETPPPCTNKLLKLHFRPLLPSRLQSRFQLPFFYCLARWSLIKAKAPRAASQRKGEEVAGAKVCIRR